MLPLVHMHYEQMCFRSPLLLLERTGGCFAETCTVLPGSREDNNALHRVVREEKNWSAAEKLWVLGEQELANLIEFGEVRRDGLTLRAPTYLEAGMVLGTPRAKA